MSDDDDSTPAPALSNQDFRRFLTTPMHPSMQQKEKPTTAAASAAGGKTPAAAAAGSATPGPPGVSLKVAPKEKTMTYADGDMKTVRITRRGLEGGRDADADEEGGEGGEDGEGADGDSSSATAATAGGKKGPRVLSSRERSYIAFQAKQALKVEAKTRYRDRAKERQQDANPDYAPDSVGMVDGEEVSIEASKYLGGDLAHTHMVKGLDFALLNKVRDELEKQEEAKLEALVEEQRQARIGGVALPAAAPTTAASTTAGTPTKPAALAAPAPLVTADGVQFKLPSTGAIYALAMFSSSRKQSTDLFLPGRMTFSFPLTTRPPRPDLVAPLQHAQQTASALPSAVVTSFSDLAAAQASWAEEHVRGALPHQLWTRLTGIFKMTREAEEERRARRKKGLDAGGGYNVLPEDHVQPPQASRPMEVDEGAVPMPALEDPSAAAAPTAATDDAPMEMDYSVPRPPPAAEDSDDDDIFGGVGSDYQARVDEGPALPPAQEEEEEEDDGSYNVPRPPPDSDDEEGDEEEGEVASAPAASAAVVPRGLFGSSSSEPAIRQLDKHASRIPDEEEGSDDDMFGPGESSTAAGDALLAGADVGGATKKPQTAADRLKAKNAEFADAEYASLFPDYQAGYSMELDDEDDEDDGAAKKKPLPGADGSEEGAKKGRRAGGAPGKPAASEEELDAKKREARFNAEFSQVSQMLQARGVKGLNDDSKRRQTKPRADEDDARAIKRQKILRGFAPK